MSLAYEIVHCVYSAEVMSVILSFQYELSVLFEHKLLQDRCPFSHPSNSIRAPKSCILAIRKMMKHCACFDTFCALWTS